MLHVEIEGYWDPEDFVDVLTGLESLYYKSALESSDRLTFPFYLLDRLAIGLSYEEHLDHSNELLLARARLIAPPDIRMGVARIEYASPGSIDLFGVGDACKAIEAGLARVLDFFEGRRRRREWDKQEEIKTEMFRESLKAMQLKNAREIWSQRRDFPEVADDFLLALAVRDQDKLTSRIAERKIVAVSATDDRPPTRGQRA